MSTEVLAIVQVAANIMAALTIVFMFWQVRIATRQLRKQNDKAATEFVLDAEGQFDGMFEALLGQDAAVIRICYEKEVDPHWTDSEVKKYIFFLRYYGHISRMVYLVRNQALDIGMVPKQRDNLLAPWEARLFIFKDDPIMQRIHRNALKFRNYNDHMLALSTKVFGEA